MNIKEVEMILFKVSVNNQDAIFMKIYKDGTLIRTGAGGLPPVDIGGIGFTYTSNIFDQVISKIPQDALEKPINYEEEIPNGFQEWVVAFYGVSKNGETGEHAEWAKSTGIRILLDLQSKFQHQIMGFLDGLTIDTLELTNEWYFDVMMFAVHKAKSSNMPETMIATSNSKEELQKNYNNYLTQLINSPVKLDLNKFINNKVYLINEKKHRCIINQNNNEININFISE